MTDVLAIANQFRADVQNADAALIQELTRRWQAVERSLQAQIDALALELDNARLNGEAVSESRLYQMDRYQALLVQLRAELAQFNTTAAQMIQAQQLDFAALGSDQAAEWLRYAGALRGSFAQLGAGAFENVLALAQAGQPLAALLDNAYPAAAQGLTNVLLNGIAQGWNPNKTARAMMQEGLSDGLQHILLVSRDQSLRAWRTASLQQYQASGLVTGYRRLCARQTRTCLACLALDGTVYPTSQIMPMHPQCRCAMLPIVRGYALPEMPSGEAWFRSQSQADQRAMLGPERAALWERGGFRFQDLATITDGGVWGASAQITSVKALQQRGTV